MRIAGKIAAVSAVVGLMVAAIVWITLRQLPARKVAEAQSPPTPAIATDRLARCRTITAPDAQCTAAWNAARRHFFGDEPR